MDQDPYAGIRDGERRCSDGESDTAIDAGRDEQDRPADRRDDQGGKPPSPEHKAEEDQGRDHVNALRPVSCSPITNVWTSSVPS